MDIVEAAAATVEKSEPAPMAHDGVRVDELLEASKLLADLDPDKLDSGKTDKTSIKDSSSSTTMATTSQPSSVMSNNKACLNAKSTNAGDSPDNMNSGSSNSGDDESGNSSNRFNSGMVSSCTASSSNDGAFIATNLNDNSIVINENENVTVEATSNPDDATIASTAAAAAADEQEKKKIKQSNQHQQNHLELQQQQEQEKIAAAETGGGDEENGIAVRMESEPQVNATQFAVDYSAKNPWHASYVRTRHRNLRCFPCCSITHKESSFCGVPISVQISGIANSNNWFILGSLRRLNDPLLLRVGAVVPDIIPEVFRSNRIIVGQVTTTTSATSPTSNIYDFVPPRRWKYNCRLAKHTARQTHLFTLYICDKATRVCRQVANGPTFQIKSAWRQNSGTVPRPSYTTAGALGPSSIPNSNPSTAAAAATLKGASARTNKNKRDLPSTHVQSSVGTPHGVGVPLGYGHAGQHSMMTMMYQNQMVHQQPPMMYVGGSGFVNSGGMGMNGYPMYASHSVASASVSTPVTTAKSTPLGVTENTPDKPKAAASASSSDGVAPSSLIKNESKGAAAGVSGMALETQTGAPTAATLESPQQQEQYQQSLAQYQQQQHLYQQYQPPQYQAHPPQPIYQQYQPQQQQQHVQFMQQPQYLMMQPPPPQPGMQYVNGPGYAPPGIGAGGCMDAYNIQYGHQPPPSHQQQHPQPMQQVVYMATPPQNEAENESKRQRI